MELHAIQSLVYRGTQTRVSNKTGNQYQLIKLGDPVNYENYDFFKSDDLIMSDIYEGDNVMCTFKAVKQGFNLNLNLLSITKTK